MPFPLLSLKSSAEQVCDAQGPADTQLSCQRSSNAKPPWMLTLGKTVLHRWKLQQQKNSLHLFLYQIKSFGNSCLSGWEWELVLRQQKISLSDVSTTNTLHHLRFKGGAFDPFPALLCLSCCLPSKKSSGRKCSVHSWNSNHRRAVCMEMVALLTLCPRFPHVPKRKGWDRQLCLSIQKVRSRSNTYIKVTSQHSA